MSSKIINPYGTEIRLLTDGIFYKAVGRNDEVYVSDDKEAVIAAFMEDVFEDGQVFLSKRTSKNYKAVLSQRLSWQNNDKPAYAITESKDYLV